MCCFRIPLDLSGLACIKIARKATGMGKFLRLGWVVVCVIVLLMSVQVLGQAFGEDRVGNGS